MEVEKQSELSCCAVNYASVPETVEIAEQIWEQKKSTTEDHECTELATTIQELLISDETKEDNGNHEQDEVRNRAEDSQCNVYWPTIARAMESDKEQEELTGVPIKMMQVCS